MRNFKLLILNRMSLTLSNFERSFNIPGEEIVPRDESDLVVVSMVGVLVTSMVFNEDSSTVVEEAAVDNAVDAVPELVALTVLVCGSIELIGRGFAFVGEWAGKVVNRLKVVCVTVEVSGTVERSVGIEVCEAFDGLIGDSAIVDSVEEIVSAKVVKRADVDCSGLEVKFPVVVAKSVALEGGKLAVARFAGRELIELDEKGVDAGVEEAVSSEVNVSDSVVDADECGKTVDGVAREGGAVGTAVNFVLANEFVEESLGDDVIEAKSFGVDFCAKKSEDEVGIVDNDEGLDSLVGESLVGANEFMKEPS